MRCLGLIGGLNAPSLEIYWQTISQEVRKTLGSDSMPEFMVNSVKTCSLRSSLAHEDWPRLSEQLVDAGRILVEGGADGLVICGSALNPVALAVHRSLGVPVIDIGYSLSIKLGSLRHRQVAVLGGRTVEEQGMWEQKLAGVEVVPLSAQDQEWLVGRADAAMVGHAVTVDWKIETNRIVSSLRRRGARALILADPILSRWIKPGESLLYPINAAEIHAWIATLWAFESALLPTPPCVIVAQG